MTAQDRRRGECPTLSKPMPTGDGLLARLAPLQGGFSPAQLRGVAEAAAAHGNGVLEVTLRGNLQVRGLSAASAARLAEDLDRLGLAVRSSLAVETGPLAGLDPHEIADPRPLAARIASAVEGRLAGLGPKVSVVADGGGRLTLSGLSADIRLQAMRTGGAALWRLFLAGAAATAAPLADLPEAEAGAAAARLLLALAERGPKARARDLLNDAVLLRGIVAQAPPSALPGISPTRGEIEPAAPASPLVNASERDATLTPLISPLVGEMPGRTEGGVTHGTSPVGLFPLRDGSQALGLALPFGQIAARELAALCDAAATAGARDIRLAPRHGLLALGLDEESASVLRRAAQALGLAADPADPRLCVTACAGAPACGAGVTPTKDLAAELAAALSSREPSRIHVSGCPKRCGAPADDWELVGETPGTLTIRRPGRQSRAVARGEAVAAFRRFIEPAGGDERHRETAPAAE